MKDDGHSAELRSGPASHDPRSSVWRHPMMSHPGDGFEDAKAFHDERGYWPPGTAMREREDRERREYGDDAHPGAIGPREAGQAFAEMLRLTLDSERIGVRVSRDTYLSRSIDVRYIAEEAAYALHAFVLKERMPSTTAKVGRVVTVAVSQVSPATWKDHFKLTYGHRWWLRWVARRWPARTVERMQTRRVAVEAEFDVDRHRLYPLASAGVVRQFGEPVHVALVQRMRWTDWKGDPGVTT